MSRHASTYLMIVFTAMSLITLGRAPCMVRPDTRDLEVQISVTAASSETS